MFSLCEKLSEINMINWDMSSLIGERGWFFSYSPIFGLFNGCKNLKMIKINPNFIHNSRKEDKIFEGLPEGGKFFWKRGVNCNNLLNVLPVSWNREQE